MTDKHMLSELRHDTIALKWFERFDKLAEKLRTKHFTYAEVVEEYGGSNKTFSKHLQHWKDIQRIAGDDIPHAYKDLFVDFVRRSQKITSQELDIERQKRVDAENRFMEAITQIDGLQKKHNGEMQEYRTRLEQLGVQLQTLNVTAQQKTEEASHLRDELAVLRQELLLVRNKLEGSIKLCEELQKSKANLEAICGQQSRQIEGYERAEKHLMITIDEMRLQHKASTKKKKLKK